MKTCNKRHLRRNMHRPHTLFWTIELCPTCISDLALYVPKSNQSIWNLDTLQNNNVTKL